MKSITSRRAFLAAGLALPAAAKGTIPETRRTGVTTPEPARFRSAAPEMQYRKLGRSALKISALGFGCMLTSDASVLQRAADLGVNHFDTARVYQRGNNEHMVGAALKSRRKEIILASKTLAPNKQRALLDLDESLKALSTDHLDIWYLHDKRSASQITDDLIEAQQIAKQQGKVRFAGLSLHSSYAEVFPAVIRNGKIDVVLVTYNFAMEGRIDPLLQSLDVAGLGVVAMKVMAGSFGMDPSYDYQGSRQRLKRSGAPAAALRYVLRNRHVHCAIPSITDMDQLDENVRAMSVPFTEADKKLLASQLEHIRPLYCRMCGECAGACPKGLPVADMLRYLTYAEGYGQYALGREHWTALPPTLKDVRCDLCPACSIKCPYGVQVQQRLGRAQELFA